MTLGWWLAKQGESQAWVPAAYVEEQAPPPPPPVAVARPPPPPPPAANGARGKPTPPAKRPTPGAKKPLAAVQARDSGMSMNGSGSDGSRSNTPTQLSLADALLARKNAMAKKDDDDEW